MHFCQDELMALLGALPFLGFIWAWVRTKLLRKPVPLARCVERPHCEGHPPHGSVSEPAEGVLESPRE